MLLFENNEEPHELIKLKLQEYDRLENGFKRISYHYTHVWNKTLPKDVNYGSAKVILSNGNIVLQNAENKPTYMFSPDLNLSKTFPGPYGHLQGVIALNLLVYSVNAEVLLYQAEDHKLNKSLKSPEWTSYQLFACSENGLSRDATSTGSIAVVEESTKTLSIFKQNNKRLNKELKFEIK